MLGSDSEAERRLVKYEDKLLSQFTRGFRIALPPQFKAQRLQFRAAFYIAKTLIVRSLIVLSIESAGFSKTSAGATDKFVFSWVVSVHLVSIELSSVSF